MDLNGSFPFPQFHSYKYPRCTAPIQSHNALAVRPDNGIYRENYTAREISMQVPDTITTMTITMRMAANDNNNDNDNKINKDDVTILPEVV